MLLVCLKSFLAILSLHSSIRSRLREIQAHLLSEQVETLQVVDRILCAIHIVVDDEGLALALETLLRDDVNNRAEFVEEAVERLDQGRDLHALVEVANLL